MVDVRRLLVGDGHRSDPKHLLLLRHQLGAAIAGTAGVIGVGRNRCERADAVDGMDAPRRSRKEPTAWIRSKSPRLILKEDVSKKISWVGRQPL